MQERDYPKFVSLRHFDAEPYRATQTPVASPASWALRLAEIDQAHAADIEQAIQDAADIQSDIHLYKKVGSAFLGIGFERGNGPTVKVYEYPEIPAAKDRF
jgi:hypothetical protein